MQPNLDLDAIEARANSVQWELDNCEGAEFAIWAHDCGRQLGYDCLALLAALRARDAEIARLENTCSRCEDEKQYCECPNCEC